jgi:signal transduction histidine kinase
MAFPLLAAGGGFAFRGVHAVLSPITVASQMTTDSALNVGSAFAYVVIALTFNVVLMALVVTRLLADLRLQYERISALERAGAVAEERERLMLDMHDGLGSQLMATLNALERGKFSTEEVADLLRRCVEDLRLVIDSLDAGEYNLAASLANLRYRVEPRLNAAGLTLGWDVDPQAGFRLAPGAVLHVLRVVQEALTNALKHAHATRLDVCVRQDPSTGALSIEVTDNGRGLLHLTTEGNTGTRRGLANMRQRARSLGGDLETVAYQGGTCVRLHIPSAPSL